VITSSSNDYIKHLKKLQTKKSYRLENGQFIIEGIKMVKDGFSYIDTIIVSESFDMDLIPDINKKNIVEVSDKLFREISETLTPQGVMAVANMKLWGPCDLLNESPFLLFCDGVADPGNLGTIIRTADAGGMTGVILSGNCVDLYNPKTIRATMSSLFNVKICIADDSIKTINFFKNKNVTVIGSALTSSESIYETNLKPPVLIVVGNEANGISDLVLTTCDKYVKIPMIGKAESLNVGVAASLLIYESVRQSSVK